MMLSWIIFDLVKVISLRKPQIMHSSRRVISHPQWYTCHQCQHAQQGSGLWPALCVSDLPQCGYVVFDVLFPLSYVLDMVFTKLWSCSWNSYHILGKLYLKEEERVFSLNNVVIFTVERCCVCAHGVTIGFVSLRTLVALKEAMHVFVALLVLEFYRKFLQGLPAPIF